MSTATPASAARPRRDTKAVFNGPGGAPSVNIGLPRGICITAIEFLTYLPNGTRNYEPLLRFVQTGLDHGKLAKIVNFHRHLVKPALGNSCGTVVRHTMRKGTGNEVWNMSVHKDDYIYERDWNGDELTFNGVELNCHRYADPAMKANIKTDTIAFADLAQNVIVHPSYNKGDGFMLTRCVQYAAANPDKKYVFPNHYRRLVRKLYDGRRLTDAHNDKEVFKRWGKRDVVQNYGNHEVEVFNNVLDSDDDSDDDSEAGLFNFDDDDDSSEDSLGSDTESMEVEASVGAASGSSAVDNNSFPSTMPPMTGNHHSFGPLSQGGSVQENSLPAFPTSPSDREGHNLVNNAAPSHELERHAANHTFLPARPFPVTAGRSVHGHGVYPFPVQQNGMVARSPLPTIHPDHRSVGDPVQPYEVGSDSWDQWDLEDALAPPVVRKSMFGTAAAPPPFMAHAAGQNNFQPIYNNNGHYHMHNDQFSYAAEQHNFQAAVDDDNGRSPVNRDVFPKAQSSGGVLGNNMDFFNANNAPLQQMVDEYEDMSDGGQEMAEYDYGNEFMFIPDDRD